MNYEELVKALRDIEKTMFALGTSPINMGDVSISLAYDKRWGQTAERAAAAIEALQAQLPKRGEWIYKPKDAIEMMFTLPKCSVCGHESSDANNYCPNCGAKMEVQDGKRCD